MGTNVHIPSLSSGRNSESNDAPLAQTVLKRRAELGLSQTDLADLAGTSRRFVHVLEHGKPNLRLDKLLNVLEVLGLDLVVSPGRGRIR